MNDISWKEETERRERDGGRVRGSWLILDTFLEPQGLNHGERERGVHCGKTCHMNSISFLLHSSPSGQIETLVEVNHSFRIQNHRSSL